MLLIYYVLNYFLRKTNIICLIYLCDLWIRYWLDGHFYMKIVFPCMAIPIIKMRQFWHLIFIMAIPILVRWHLYIEITPAGPCLNIKTVLPGMGIPMLKIKRSRDRLIFNMGMPILVRRHLYIETAPGSWNPSFSRARTCISYIINVMVAMTWRCKEPGHQQSWYWPMSELCNQKLFADKIYTLK